MTDQKTKLNPHIIFEDEQIVVLDKDAGVVVNKSMTYAQETIQDWMAHRLGLNTLQVVTKHQKTDPDSSDYGTPEEIFAARQGIVHRLDKDTSGILILAKTPQALVELMRQFKSHLTKKTYVALVHGKVTPQEGIIRLPLDRSEQNRTKFAVRADGRLSQTHYRAKAFFPGLPKGIHQKKGKSYQGFSLVELFPKTGRTHQIRVHMSAIHHPLVGDGLYVGKKRALLDREWCPRQFLHATQLCFLHPLTQKETCFTSKLPADLQAVLDKFTPKE